MFYIGRVKEILNVGIVDEEPVIWFLEDDSYWLKEVEIQCIFNESEEYISDDYEYIGTLVVNGVAQHYFVRYSLVKEYCNKVVKLWQDVAFMPEPEALGLVA